MFFHNTTIATLLGPQKCHILEQCFDLGPGYWGEHLYGIYVYASSKDLGVQNDDAVPMNVYAMATYTDSACTVKNTINPMAILSSSCTSSSCCKTTTVTESNVSISYLILESVPVCPSDDAIIGGIKETTTVTGLVDANGVQFFNWQFLMLFIVAYMIVLQIHERKQTAARNNGYTNVDNNDNDTVEVELPSIHGSDKMFRTTRNSDYEEVE